MKIVWTWWCQLVQKLHGNGGQWDKASEEDINRGCTVYENWRRKINDGKRPIKPGSPDEMAVKMVCVFIKFTIQLTATTAIFHLPCFPLGAATARQLQCWRHRFQWNKYVFQRLESTDCSRLSTLPAHPAWVPAPRLIRSSIYSPTAQSYAVELLLLPLSSFIWLVFIHWLRIYEQRCRSVVKYGTGAQDHSGQRCIHLI